MIQIKTLSAETFTWLFVESRKSAPEPTDLLTLEFPDVDGSKGIVISSGKLHAWTTDGLISHYRNRSKWQARYDPLLKGAIVTHSFAKEYPVTKVLPLKLPCLACAEEGRETLLRAGAIYPYCQQYGHQNYAPERQNYKSKK